MRAIFLVAACALFAGAVSAQTYVKPHIRKDGTFVEGHVRSAPNNTRADNYGSQGNSNPWTGQQGRIDPYAQPNPYQAPRQQVCGTNSQGQYVCR